MSFLFRRWRLIPRQVRELQHQFAGLLQRIGRFRLVQSQFKRVPLCRRKFVQQVGQGLVVKAFGLVHRFLGVARFVGCLLVLRVELAQSIEFRSQLRHRSSHSRQHGSQGKRESVGNFLKRQVIDDSQANDAGCLGGQFFNRLPKGLREFGLFE